ncbi:MAG TPA: TrmH family RNA methyltransferase [Micromonosporaceae bacterium]|nr:TrmH family RNA methyltransferase [Micromonosporaceae bacterium]
MSISPDRRSQRSPHRPSAPRSLRVTTRNARYQQWEALLSNRNKRQRLGEFLVQGVRPIDQAIAHGWPVRTFLHAGLARSEWARDLLTGSVADELVHLSPDLLHELSEKLEAPPELLAVVAIPVDNLARIRLTDHGLVVVLDRPISPGNLGSLLRSADALGVDGVVVTGRAADLYDPKAVRASRGSLFAVPAVRVDQPSTVVDWIRSSGPMTIVGTSEEGTADLWGHDFRGPTALVIGNETSGMSAFWAGACDAVVRIPMTGSASSLNASVAASITLYEVLRQRRVGG